jgi:hypothetical protein
MRWHYHEPRNATVRWWSRERKAAERLDRAREAALAADVELRSDEPEAGWVSSAHSRDGKAHLCRAETNGAQPAWIWTGDTRRTRTAPAPPPQDMPVDPAKWNALDRATRRALVRHHRKVMG